MRCTIFTGVFFALAAVPAGVFASGDPLLTVTDSVWVEPQQTLVCVKHRFLLNESVRIGHAQELWQAERDFILDPDAGCITIVRPDTAGNGRWLRVSYRTPADSLAAVYQLQEDPHQRRAPAAPDLAGAPRPPPGFTNAADAENLDLSGSKTFGLELGNRRDLKLRQSLDLRLSGQVTRDVSLLAILSDQDVPFQPEGNTAELAELDRVLIQIVAPKASASLGDVSLASKDAVFLDVERELEGFTGSVSGSGINSRAALASAKGEFASRQFFGEDGRQGPYRLTDRTGASEVVVVAGSERVWLDGELMVRGREEDYVVDYALGEMTFTGRRVITATSEITIDYQFASARYRRRVGFAEVEGSLGSRGTLRASFFSEGDDADNPFGGDLTDAERLELAVLGDSARVAGGTRYVGPGLGDYELVVDAETGREIFVFVEGTGDYVVTFVNVGDGKGSYDPDPESSAAKTVYLFVGEGKGSFIPRRDLPAPESRNLADLRWELTGGSGAIHVEGAFSSADGNVLSPMGDNDNQGGALSASGELRAVELGSGIKISPRFKIRRVGEHFQSPGRLRPGFYTREWNLTGAETVRDESLQEAAATFFWTERLRVESQVARLALADTFTAWRQRQSATYIDSWLQIRGNLSGSRNDVSGRKGSLQRTGGDLLLRRYGVKPRFQSFVETRRRAGGESGERYRDWEASVSFPVPGSGLSAEVGLGRRLDDSLGVAGDWREVREARRGFGRIRGDWNNLALTLNYEGRRVAGGSAGGERRDIGRLDLRHQALRGAWSAVTVADLGTVGLRRRTKLIVPAVSDSAGFFDQFGNYVGSGGGYDVQYGPPGEETLTGRVDMSTRFRWLPPRGESPVPGLLQAVAWEGFFNINESSTLPLVTPRYFLSPSSYQNRETTLDGFLNERQTFDVFPNHRPLGVRLRQESRRRMVQNPQAGGGRLVEIRNQDDLAATVRSTPATGWDAEAEGVLGSRREEVDVGAGVAFVQETRIRTATVRGGRRFSLGAGRGRLSNEVSYSRETGEDRRAIGWVWRPRAEWSVTNGGRVDVRYGLTRFTERAGFTGLRGPGAPSLTEGWRLDVVGEVRLRTGVVVTAVIGMNRPRDFAATTEGRMEVRGTF